MLEVLCCVFYVLLACFTVFSVFYVFSCILGALLYFFVSCAQGVLGIFVICYVFSCVLRVLLFCCSPVFWMFCCVMCFVCFTVLLCSAAVISVF